MTRGSTLLAGGAVALIALATMRGAAWAQTGGMPPGPGQPTDGSVDAGTASPTPDAAAPTDAPTIGDAGAPAVAAATSREPDGGAATTAARDPTRPPEGQAAPPTEAATRSDAKIRAGLEVFAEYNYRSTSGPGGGGNWFHAFDVPRIHGALEGSWESVRGRVVLEAVRSASEGALIGVAGDSLVLRVREAYAAYRAFDRLEVQAGVIPTLTVPELDGTWMLRPVAASGLEANQLATPADLGAKVRLDIQDRYGFVAVAATNGEGYTSRELNRGKNLEAAVEIHPLPRGPLLPLGVFASYQAGSTGTVSARADRLTSGLVWQGVRVRGGAFFTYAWGVAQVGTQHAALGTAFVRVEPVARLLAGVRMDVAVRDVRTAPADAISTLWLTTGYRLADPLEVFLVGSRSIPTTRAENEVPGSDAWTLRVTGRVIF